jgi:hypothetical protein
MTENDATTRNFRHTLRPLSLFTFCGEAIAARGDEYQRLTRDLPLCPECRRVRDEALKAIAGKRRRMIMRQASGGSAST